MEVVFVFLLVANVHAPVVIEIGGFKTERECNTERIEVLKDIPKYFEASRCFKVWK